MASRKAKRRYGVHDLTRFGVFVIVYRLTAADLARRSGVSRRYVGELQYGRSEATRPMMVALARGCSLLIGRLVRVRELFDFGGYD
jgi:transcriptional regulator with XRE-family HTH domain